MLVTRRP